MWKKSFGIFSISTRGQVPCCSMYLFYINLFISLIWAPSSCSCKEQPHVSRRLRPIVWPWSVSWGSAPDPASPARHYFSRRFVLPAAARALETLHCCGLATGVVVSPVCTHTHTLSLSFLLLCASLISLYLCHTSPSLFVTALFVSLATCLPWKQTATSQQSPKNNSVQIKYDILIHIITAVDEELDFVCFHFHAGH